MNSMIRSTKKILAVVLAAAMIAAFLPMTQESAYAAKAKKPAQVKGLKVDVAEDNQVTVTWKKAKNAKKYTVSIKDGTTGLTASKSSKKTKLTFKGGNAVNYTIKVQGINGKKKGAFSKAVTKKTNEVVSAAVQKALDDAKEAQAKAEEAQKAAEAALKEAEEAKTAAEQRAIAAEAELEKLKKEKADKEAADAVVEAWADVPEITVDSSEDDIAAANAVISEYDELTDDQKALVPDDVKAEIEAAKAVIAEIEEAAAKIAAVKQAIKDAEAGGTVTIDEKEFIVVSKESDTAELILKNGIEDVPFDTEGGYDWASSSLRTYLNTDWLEANPTVGALAKETSYTYWIGEYDIDEDDFVYQAKTSTDHVYVPAYDGANFKVQLPQEIEAQLKTGCAFWSSCGGHLKYYDDDEGWVEEQGAYSIGEGYQFEWDSSATQTTYDGVNWVPIKVNSMFTVALD